MTCHNRRELTVASIDSVDHAIAGAAEYRVFLVDDGSTDGTGDEVAQKYPSVQVIRGDGNLFWNGGMEMAWEAAQSISPDFYLWLNDDLVLRSHSVAEMLHLYRSSKPKTLIVGITVDPQTGKLTYGGYRQHGLSKIAFRRLSQNEVECDCMNGNCVLFPSSAVNDVGKSEKKFRHAFGDTDYGLRARSRGYSIVEHKSPVGEQSRNKAYENTIATLTTTNWRYIVHHPKGVPVREWLLFCRRHAGVFWPINFVWRYIQMIVRGLRNPEL
jgi:GT2 family glycosyltransferase